MANSSRSDTLTTRIALEGGAQVREELIAIANEGERLGKRTSDGAKKASEGSKEFEGDLKSLITLFDEFERGQRGAFFSTLGEKLKEGVTGVNGMIAAVTALAGSFLALAIKGAEAASAIKEASTRVGTSAENFSKLKFVFEQSGAGAENFERAVGVIQEAASSFNAAGDDTLAAAKKYQDALAGLNKSLADAEEARGNNLEKLKRSQGERFSDLLEQQQKETADAIAKGGADLLALQEKQGKEQQDLSDRFAKEQRDQERANEDARADEQQKIFKDQQDALIAYNKEIEDLAEKAGRAQISGNFVSTDTAGKLKELGVTLQDVNGKARDSHDIFLDVADRIGAIDDAATRSTVAVGLFGRRVGPALVESLSEGRKGIEELEKEAVALGLVFSKPELDIGKRFSDTLNKLSGTLAATSDKIGLAFAPLFNEVGEALAKAFGDAQPAIVAAAHSVAEAIKPIFDGIAAAINGDFEKIQGLNELGKNAALVAGAIGEAGRIISGTFSLIMAALREIGQAIDAVFGAGVAAAIVSAAIQVRVLIGVFGLFSGAALTAAGSIRSLVTALAAMNIATLVGPLRTAAFTLGYFAAAAGSAATGLVRLGAAAVAVTNLGSLFAGVRIAIAGIVAIAGGPWAAVIIAIGALATALTVALVPMEGLTKAWNAFIEAVRPAAQFIDQNFVQPVLKLLQPIIDAFEKIKNKIKDALGQAKNDAAQLDDTIKQMNQDVANEQRQKDAASSQPQFFTPSSGTNNTGGGGSEETVYYASGGLIRGPGTGTSDSIVARVSAGEYIANAASTAVALPLLRAINSGPAAAARIMDAFGGLRRFSLGGLVDGWTDTLRDAAMPRFATGGMVTALAGAGGSHDRVSVDLSFNGKQIASDMLTPRKMAEGLRKFSASQQISSAGRRPSSYGGGRG